MFNFKTSGIIAGAAFVLSLVIGLFSGSGFLIPFIRALIFAVIFFALSCLIYWLLGQFIPELLSAGEDNLDIPLSGSRVDISVDGPVSGAFPSDNSESVDDIAGKPSASPKAASSTLDREGNSGYNEEGEVGDLEAVDDGNVMRAGSAEILPDLNEVSENVPGSATDVENTDDIGFDTSEPRKPRSSSRKSDMAGDFNPKELAQAIQTVLKRDDKG